MNLVNKQVTHELFGKGSVVKYDNAYVNVKFATGIKKFVFPDAFGRYLTLMDEKAAEIVGERIRAEEKKREKEALKLKKKRALERERRILMQRVKGIRGRRLHPSAQSVFWCSRDEQEEIFTNWSISTGSIKRGMRKGEARRLARLNYNSACLITERRTDMPEKERRITGLFMVGVDSNGKIPKEGHINAHPEFRIQLSRDESKKILFWNYYINERHPNRMVWNSGRQRYFSNIWMAQILQDIAALREKSQEHEYIQGFLQHFCKINGIKIEDLPKPAGALISS